MIPSAYKVLKEFPRTQSGKTHRNALVCRAKDSRNGKNCNVKSFAPAVKITHGFWSEAFKTNDILLKGDFFKMGGNSLIAISVFSIILKAFKTGLGLRVSFDSPRIKDITEAVDILTLNAPEERFSLKRAYDKSTVINREI